MTEIKTAQAWGHRSSPSALLHHAGRESAMFNVPYVIVHGLTEAEVHEAAALLEKSREGAGWFCPHCKSPVESNMVTFEETHDVRYGGCGRKVVVK